MEAETNLDAEMECNLDAKADFNLDANLVHLGIKGFFPTGLYLILCFFAFLTPMQYLSSHVSAIVPGRAFTRTLSDHMEMLFSICYDRPVMLFCILLDQQ